MRFQTLRELVNYVLQLYRSIHSYFLLQHLWSFFLYSILYYVSFTYCCIRHLILQQNKFLVYIFKPISFFLILSTFPSFIEKRGEKEKREQVPSLEKWRGVLFFINFFLFFLSCF